MPNIGRNGSTYRVHLRAWDDAWICDCEEDPNRSVPNVGCWMQTLQTRWGLDNEAAGKLDGLSRVDRKGYMHANAIIGKLLKKVNDDRPLRSASAFVTVSVRRAYEHMDQW